MDENNLGSNNSGNVSDNVNQGNMSGQANTGNVNGQYSNYQDNTANIPYQVQVENVAGNKANGLQIAGLVCGILAICTSCCYGIPGIILGIVGLVCSILGNKNNKNGLGIGGLVCSIIGLIFGIVMLIYYAWIIAMLFESGYGSEYMDIWDQLY